MSTFHCDGCKLRVEIRGAEATVKLCAECARKEVARLREELKKLKP